MTRVENDDLKEVRRDTNTYEDEISLMDYFLVLWKRKWFILLASVLPTLMVGLIIFLGPRLYTLTYTYDVKDQLKDQIKDLFRDRTTMDVSNWDLDGQNYNVLLTRFYSKENLSRIITRLQQDGFSEYAEDRKSVV